MTKPRIYARSSFAAAANRARLTLLRFWMWRIASVVFVACFASAVASQAQTFSTVLQFDFTDGAFPQFISLAQGANGNLYAEATDGGSQHLGTIFEVTTQGSLVWLKSMPAPPPIGNGPLGEINPFGGLTLGSDGNFYGVLGCQRLLCLEQNEPLSGGMVFRISPTGQFTSLYSFCSQTNCTDGQQPHGRLIQASNGTFYGTTYEGGANNGGAVFSITLTGTFATVYSFCSQAACADGEYPQGGLVQGTDGNLYGTTSKGGAKGDGTVFKISTGGTLTTLYSFCSLKKCDDGRDPNDSLVQGTDGNFYGTTVYGGKESEGTVFKISSSGELTTLYSFCAETACADGSEPYANLIQASDGNFYGTTDIGGTNNDGTVFSINSAGALTTIYSFCSQTACTDGANPNSGLLQANNGVLYGMTNQGGITETCPWKCSDETPGVIYSLDLGLAPPVGN
jgi:uncharacterized repeat protein (TIGR03803 family)